MGMATGIMPGEHAKSIVECPNCGSRDVQLSRTQSTLLDSVMSLFDKRAYRCHACLRRFHARPRAGEAEDAGRQDDGNNRRLVR
jgi:DNA-directed RNA polymerase subunit RPC12/RpoP